MIDFSLSEEQKILKQTARDFAQNELLEGVVDRDQNKICLLYTSPSPRDRQKSRMPSSA